MYITKAKELIDKFYQTTPNEAWINEPLGLSQKYTAWNQAKECALIAVENEYYSLREMLFNLKACNVIKSEKTYLHRLQYLIDEEQKVKTEIIKL